MTARVLSFPQAPWRSLEIAARGRQDGLGYFASDWERYLVDTHDFALADQLRPFLVIWPDNFLTPGSLSARDWRQEGRLIRPRRRSAERGFILGRIIRAEDFRQLSIKGECYV